MKPINGVYVGWIPPHSHLWEPLYRTVRCGRGYESQRTKAYAPAIKQYPGLETALKFKADLSDLPYALNKRTPKVRDDYERNARLLRLSYPNLDLFEFIGRAGGLFSGDPFTVCPIVNPNDDGSYTYEFILSGVDPNVREKIDDQTQLKPIVQADRLTLLTADSQPLGTFSPHFTHLGSEIFNLNIVRIGRPEHVTGNQTVVSFDTMVNLCGTPEFALVDREVMVNV